MKRKLNKTSQSAGKTCDKIPTAAKTPISSSRRWCFRLIALLVPLLFLGVLELGLRVAGYGYPTAFFLNDNDNGRAVVTSNPKFGWRFFPPAIAGAPTPLYFPAQKPRDTVRIFVFGESAAMGDPAPAYGFARQLERLLRARHPNQKIEVIDVAMTAINSHVIRQIAHDCAPRQGDFWLVYAGNNEVIGPFGEDTTFGGKSPSLTTVRAILALKTTRIGQFIAQVTRPADEPKESAGLEFFLKWQIADDNPRLNRVYQSFGANLRDIADSGRRSGATVLLATMPVNLLDFPPLASVHRVGLKPEQLADWQKLFSIAKEAQAAGDFSEAISGFWKASEIDDEFAELVFQRARCEMELKQTAAAEADFRRACDLDTLRLRADSRINEIVRQTAKAKGISLIDTDRELWRFAPSHLFYDHVHLNFTGNYKVALLFAAELENHWPGPRANDSPWLTETEIAQRLAWTDFDKRRAGEEMRARMRQPPFNSQSNFRERDEHWNAQLVTLAAPACTCISNYQIAVALAPEDWRLHADFARVSEASGDNTNAMNQWAEVARLLPHSSEGWANLGRLARIAGETEEAKKFIAKALKQQPDSVETLTESGILHASLGETQAARRDFRSALRWQPGFVTARVNLGLLLARAGNVDGAAAEYREALRWRTNSVDARINLANLLSAQHQTNEAIALYEQATALEPENSVARYNFGRLLVSENRLGEAVANFQEALRQQPDAGEIHFELGNALSRLGREPEALGEFAEAVRLQPDLADAHLNYGMGLAGAGRHAEAVAELRAALRLHPQDERAQRMLDKATRLASPDGANH